MTGPHVTTNGDSPVLPAAHAEHRREWWEFVLREAEPWHRKHLRRLFDVWADANRDYYDDRLTPPYLLLNEPSNPRRFGDCGPVSGFGCRSQIRIRPSLLTGTHPRVASGPEFAEGRELFVADILLHEQIHQYQQEIVGEHRAGLSRSWAGLPRHREPDRRSARSAGGSDV